MKLIFSKKDNLLDIMNIIFVIPFSSVCISKIIL